MSGLKVSEAMIYDGSSSGCPTNLTRMMEDDWATILRVLAASCSRQGARESGRSESIRRSALAPWCRMALSRRTSLHFFTPCSGQSVPHGSWRRTGSLCVAPCSAGRVACGCPRSFRRAAGEPTATLRIMSDTSATLCQPRGKVELLFCVPRLPDSDPPQVEVSKRSVEEGCLPRDDLDRSRRAAVRPSLRSQALL
jgi:hypothetical protein